MLDHGILNLPLAKRGDIDAQIDKYKAEQARQAKTQARERAALLKLQREQAKAALAAMPAEQLARIAQRLSLTTAQARAELKSIAYFTPARVLALKSA